MSDVLVGCRAGRRPGSTPAKVKELTRELDLRRCAERDRRAREDRGAAMIFAIILLMILYTSIIMWGQIGDDLGDRGEDEPGGGGRSAPASRPTTLLAGKLLGVGGAGLTQFLIWALSLFGVSLAMAGRGRWLLLDARDHAAPPRVVRALLPARVPVLRGALRGDRLGGQHGAGGAEPRVPGAACRSSSAMVCFPTVLESPDGAAGRRAVDDPRHLAAHHVPEDRRAHAAAVADRAVDRPPRARHPRRRSGSPPGSTGSAS